MRSFLVSWCRDDEERLFSPFSFQSSRGTIAGMQWYFPVHFCDLRRVSYDVFGRYGEAVIRTCATLSSGIRSRPVAPASHSVVQRS
jgi:hypothetical protein